MPQSRCKRRRSEAAEPGPTRRAGGAEGENLPDAHKRSHQNKLAAQSRTQVPSSSSAGLSRKDSGPAEIFLLVVWCLEKKERHVPKKKKVLAWPRKKTFCLFAVVTSARKQLRLSCQSSHHCVTFIVLIVNMLHTQSYMCLEKYIYKCGRENF